MRVLLAFVKHRVCVEWDFVLSQCFFVWIRFCLSEILSKWDICMGGTFVRVWLLSMWDFCLSVTFVYVGLLSECDFCLCGTFVWVWLLSMWDFVWVEFVLLGFCLFSLNDWELFFLCVLHNRLLLWITYAMFNLIHFVNAVAA